ncbi:MAG TPA: hypothetical protein VIH78_02165 [Terriglobales bacterium]
MATSAIATPELSVSTAKAAYESYPLVTLKQRFEKLLREVFEGHEEYLGVTGLVGFVLSLR